MFHTADLSAVTTTMIMKSLDDLWPFCIVLCVGVALAAFTLLVLACQIIWPNIVTYPWKENEEQIDTTVIFAASYNPPHFGHIQILEYLSKRYSKVIAVVGFNPDKKYLVAPKERAALLREMLKSITAKNIEVVGESLACFRLGLGLRFLRAIADYCD